MTSRIAHLASFLRSGSRSLALVLIPAALAAQSQAPGAFEFSIANMMRGPELYGREPDQIRWTPDGRWIYFRWNEPGTDWREPLRPYRVRAEPGARPERVTTAHLDSVGPLIQPGRYSPDRRLRAVEFQGDLYVVDMQRNTARRLTETLGIESSPDFSADGRRIFFVRDNNVFSLELEGGLVRQVSDIRPGPAPRERARADGQRAALESQQRELFESVRDRLRADSIAEAERKQRETQRGRTLYLNANERVTSLAVSPSGRALLVSTVVPNDRALNTKVPNYITASGYTEDLNARTKVGDAQSSGRLAYISLPSGDVRVLRLTPGDTTRPPAFASLLGWNETGTHALVSAVTPDFKTRFLHTVSADSGAVKTVDTLRDTAWVAGPCFGCGGWYDGGRRFWYVSEADGWAQLYSQSADGSDKRQLTQGRFEVYGVVLSRDKRSFYLSTSEKSPFERHFYRMSVDGGAREQISERVGSHDITLSPDEQWLADVHGTANRPPELHLARNRKGAELAQLTTSPTADWLAHKWIVPEIVMIPASDGVQVPARIYRPQDQGATARGAAVIFVHGAGYLHNVHNYWSSYAREYMFNQYLASKGYVVLDVDYRASAGYGRDWRTAIYRHMGGRDLQDHVDASRWLRREHGIDPERVGIYGGSYGGFITLMALFTAPEHFGAGAALRSVTDWAHYNHTYTGRILNVPQTDTLAYRRSSPIYFAKGLSDPLLMAHGMVDVNVHFSDIVRLTQRLIELGKTNWELAVYPVEDHGFVRPDSWTDEYRRIFELFEKNLGPARTTGAATSSGGSRR
jgi:dipeptidyl aminopeptidase/acylaminoacyl peptidase